MLYVHRSIAQWSSSILTLVVLLTSSAVYGQSKDGYPRLMQGPMVGATFPDRVNLWVRANGPYSVLVELAQEETFREVVARAEGKADSKDDYCVVLSVSGLQPSTRYFYRIHVDGDLGKYQRDRRPASLRTAPKRPGAFRVCFGSCARFQIDRVQPIWGVVQGLEPDLFFWLGDNIYGDSRDPEILAEEYRRQRDVASLQPLIREVPQLAIWDDHDYGLNNHNASHPAKEVALGTFRQYWANPAYGLPGAPGIFFAYHYGGVDFFFLDNRFYRSPNDDPDGPDKTMLGERQFAWLVDRLTLSTAAFKVLVIGGGWNTGRGADGDAWSAFQHERDRLFATIAEEKIEGVLLFSGDTHFGELNRIPVSGSYDLIEVVSSPLAQAPDGDAPSLARGESRVRESYHLSPNVAVVDFDTTQDDPQARINLMNVHGRYVWEPLTLRASELRHASAR